MRHESAASAHAHEGSVTPLQPLGGLLRSVLARLFHRRSSPPNPNNTPSNPISASRALGGLAVVLALAVGLLFLLPGGLAWAQDAGTILYPENATGPVATYTAMDPEQTAITSWTLAGTDAAAFTIEGGVLRFAKSPDYETPADVVGTNPSTAAANDNSYEITVKAMDSTGKTGEKAVTVDVTDVNEPGTVTLSALRPQVSVVFTASLTDLDATASNSVTNPTWQWAKSSSKNGSYTDIDGAEVNTYTPTDAVGKSDIGDYLRATVS